MVGRDKSDGGDGGCGVETGADADVDSVEVASCGCELDPLQPRSHAIIKTEEKMIFKSGFIDTTLTHAL
jgi:hypothetical protein